MLTDRDQYAMRTACYEKILLKVFLHKVWEVNTVCIFQSQKIFTNSKATGIPWGIKCGIQPCVCISVI